MDELYILTVVVIAVLFFFISEYSLHVNKPYPSWFMGVFAEPWVRFVLYTSVYVLACVNIHISILLAIIVVLLHIDYMTLAK